jgi:DNA-binding winged helix-turn-helix (wHTH) protein
MTPESPVLTTQSPESTALTVQLSPAAAQEQDTGLQAPGEGTLGEDTGLQAPGEGTLKEDTGLQTPGENTLKEVAGLHAGDSIQGGLPDTQGDGTFRQGGTFGNLELRPDEMQALVAGMRVGLTVREFQVLAVLAGREDRVMRRPEIYRQVWGGEMKHRDRAVDVFVRKVRTKLAAVAPSWTYIHTHFGIGYRFAPELVASAPEPTALGAQQRAAASA